MENRFSWRSIVAGICALLAASGIYKNIEHGIPDNAQPSYVVGLYTPAALLIVIGIALIVSEFRRNATAQEKGPLD
jgi:hypothetical protein